ncbi:M24 family metallopeptidase [Trichococcus paludicola]|uniref:M24 family metallopeptidase n=1 Tax=Trichococcus paludicola TaxID=2052942 RepID=UPI000D3C62B7|nr:Xaa-Pro peptidase family protein [Trichococcus paludicola]
MPLNSVINLMKKQDIDIVFLNDPKNVFYVSSYRSDPHERILAAILFKDAKPLLFVPALEENDARNTAADFDVVSYTDTQDPWTVLATSIKERHSPLSDWSIEKDFLTVERMEALRTHFPTATFGHNISETLQKMRLIKTEQELTFMKEAGQWADEALKIGANTLREGITELEVVAEIEYQLKKGGVAEMSFTTMVLFGENAASPHGVPGDTKLKLNQFVLFDLGTMHEGYASDVTRTLFFGDRPSVRQQELYDLVLAAHDAAMAAVRPGITAGELDAAARKIIADAGYGRYFNHRLGHGLGQGVHEYPSIMEGNELALTEGMCFSIEPGIYIEGDIGVRVEDCGFVSADGFESFTHTPTGIDAYSKLIN